MKTIDLKSLISMSVIVSSLLVVVFCKMEVRRMGYRVVETLGQYHDMEDQRQLSKLMLVRHQRTRAVKTVAQR